MLVVVRKHGKVIAVFKSFLSKVRREFFLNVAKKIHRCYPADPDTIEWIRREHQRLANFGGRHGDLGFLVEWGKQGFVDGVSSQKV